MLIGAGHRFEEIKQYTLTQFKGFLLAASRAETRAHLRFLTGTAIAAQGNSDAIRSAVDQLLMSLDPNALAGLNQYEGLN